ncbi:MAG: hypothetical protein ACYTFT_15805, partial [Planctomycetota bacterium]
MSSDLGGEAGAPIERGDLVGLFHEAADRAAPRPAPLLGVETEWLPVDPETGACQPFLGSGGVVAFFEYLRDELGFEDPIQNGPPTHLRRGDLTINIEPGG